MGAGGSVPAAGGGGSDSSTKLRRFSLGGPSFQRASDREAAPSQPDLPTDHSRTHRPRGRISISVHRKNSLGEYVRDPLLESAVS